MRTLLQSLQLLTGFESDSFSRRDGYLRSGPGIPADTSLARLHVEDAETAQLNAVAVLESLLDHAVDLVSGAATAHGTPRTEADA